MDRALILSFAGALLMAACATESPIATPSNAFDVVGVNGQANYVVIDPSISSDKAALTEIAEFVCLPQDSCQALFWDDPLKAPRNAPMTAAQDAAMVASYTVNKKANFTEMLVFGPSE
jgi:hypothetical protein